MTSYNTGKLFAEIESVAKPNLAYAALGIRHLAQALGPELLA